MSEASGGGLDPEAMEEELAGLVERPVAEHPEVLERVHARLAAELDRLVIPKAGEQGRR